MGVEGRASNTRRDPRRGALLRALRGWKMRRIFLLAAISLFALVAVRSVAAAPQHKANATLTGVVLGPDDRPVPHASITYQSSGGNAPHAVHADSRGHYPITKLRADNRSDERRV